MSGTPNLCVDIFSQIYSMLGNLQSIATDPSSTFTHGQGFTQTPSDGLQQLQQSPGQDPVNFLAWLLIGMMLVFLMFASNRADPEDLKANIRRQNFNGNNGNNNDGDSIH